MLDLAMALLRLLGKALSPVSSSYPQQPKLNFRRLRHVVDSRNAGKRPATATTAVAADARPARALSFGPAAAHLPLQHRQRVLQVRLQQDPELADHHPAFPERIPRAGAEPRDGGDALCHLRARLLGA